MAAKSSGETPDTQNSDPAPIRPTLKTIAELTGFAVQTVSRALSDAPDISARTKEQVRKVADDIGYVPNRAGVRLRTGRTNVIALVLPTDNDVLNLTSRLISAIAEGLRDTPYHLVMTPSFSDDDPMKAVRYIVQNGTADAIILNQIQPEDPRVRFLLDRGFPFVTHGRTVWSKEHPFFDYDNNAFARLAVQRLVDHGRRKLLLLAPPLSQNYAIEILSGAREEASKLGVDLILLDGIDSDSHRSEIRARVAQVLRDDPHVDGLISASPNATMAAIAGLEDAGRSLGDGIDVFSKETVPILDLFRAGILKEPEDVAKAGRFLARAAVQAAARDGSPMMQDLDRPG